MEHQNQSQNQNNQRRTMAAAGTAAGTQNLPHPPPQPCPRCNSNNTKFCYYNNYSLSQPRYFCKGCRRYWTHGGTLRNVPVGGGSRKRKRPKLASPAAVPRAARDAPAGFEQVGGGGGSNSNNNGVMNIGQSLACGSLLGTPVGGGGGATAAAAAFYGGAGGFLPSLAGIPAVNFGSNLGLLHGLGLPNLDHHGLPQPQHHHQQHQQQQQQQQQETMSFQELLHHHHQQNIHPSLIPTLQAGDWILNNNSNNNNNNMENNNDNNNNTNNSNNNNDPDQWPDFQVGSTGLEDP